MRSVARLTLLAIVLSLSISACSQQGSGSAAPGSAGSPSNPGSSGASSATPDGSSPGGTAGAATSGPPGSVPASGTWARVEVDGPAPEAREDHTWTVDGEGRTAYLFGGRDGGSVFDDLWAFDLATDAWRQVPIAGERPAPRFGHEAAWVPGRGLAVFAGQAGATFYDDVWLFDPATSAWRLLPAGGSVPVARYGSCSGIGPDGRLWISHGFTEDGVRFADTAAYDFDAEAWTDQAPAGDGPVERCLHACWWTSDGGFVLYGGQTTNVPALGDLWLLTPGAGGAPSNRWAKAANPEPAARQLTAVARRDSLTVLFGGRDINRKALADLWLLPDGAAAFVPLEATGPGPAARSGATLIHDPVGDRLVLFGGLGDAAFDELWSLTFP